MGLSVEIEPSTGRADSGVIEIDLEELVEDLAPALQEQQRSLALFVDELQDLDPELLGALLAVQHRAGQRGWPFVIVGAGLPSVPGALTAAKSYAERLFDYREIGSLPPGEDSSTGAVAERLGVAATATSQARHNLIRKGIVYAPQRGLIAFTVPHMREFVRRQAELDFLE